MNDKTTAPALSRRAFARWMWRQLTSMRTALFLLLLLAVAAIPGSLVPQRSVDARAVEAFFARHPSSAPVLDDLGFFNVYTSPWFSAIYLLLMVSLVGCILPRAVVYAKALRARPPKAPRNFSRLPASVSFTTDRSSDEVMAAAREVIGRARIDVVGNELRAERGYLRELGNLVFHVCLVVVLVGVAGGSLLGYRGAAIVSQGDGFSNALTQYDEFSSGALFDTDDLPPFSLTLDDFTAQFELDGPQRGAPRSFEAKGRYTEKPGGDEKTFDITVNHPLSIGSSSVYLVGQGYAPVIRVTDPDGNVVFDDAVPFLPSDGTYTSTGVVKVPDAQPEQIGLQGFFLPTAVSVDGQAPISAFPGAANPLLGLFAYHGDLGIDDGTPQSVFILDKSKLTPYLNEEGGELQISLSPGQEQQLDDGTIVSFVDLRQFARFQISSSPLVGLPLFGVSIGVLGLIMSLSIRPRRTWVRTRADGSRTLVEVAVLDRVPRDDLPADLDDIIERFRRTLGDDEETA